MSDLAETLILNSAARRDDGCVVIPKLLKPADARAAVERLLARRLIRRSRAAGAMSVWSMDERGRPIALTLTQTGRRAATAQREDGGRVRVALARASAATSSKSRPAAQASKATVKKASKGKPGKAAPAKTRPASLTKGKTDAAPRATSKLAQVTAMLRAPKGASVAELSAATGWQHHSVRGAISGTLKKKLGLDVTSQRVDGVRRYRIGA